MFVQQGTKMIPAAPLTSVESACRGRCRASLAVHTAAAHGARPRHGGGGGPAPRPAVCGWTGKGILQPWPMGIGWARGCCRSMSRGRSRTRLALLAVVQLQFLSYDQSPETMNGTSKQLNGVLIPVITLARERDQLAAGDAGRFRRRGKGGGRAGSPGLDEIDYTELVWLYSTNCSLLFRIGLHRD